MGAIGAERAAAIEGAGARGWQATWLAAVPAFAREVLLPFAVSRAFLLASALAALALFPLHAGDGPWTGSPANPVLGALSRWDGKWYLSIVQHGFSYQTGAASNVAFAPLYPWLVRFVGNVLGQTADTAWAAGIGIVLSNVLLLVFLGYARALATRLWGPAVGWRVVLAVLAFPTSFFLSAVYAESLFLALAVAAFYYATSGRWWLVGALGALAALSRSYGVLLALPLAVEYLQARGWKPGARLLWLGLIPASAIGWAGALALRYGDPLILFHVQAAWNRRLMNPVDTYRRYTSVPMTLGPGSHSWTDVGATAVLLVLVVGCAALRRASLALLAFLLYVPLVTGGSLISLPRFGLEIFPIYFLLALALRWRAALAAYVLLGSILGAAAFGAFALGWWIA